jgi:serine/threonine protein kinase
MTGRLKQPFWIVPLAIAGLVALFGWWGDGQLRQTVQKQLAAELTTTLNANVTALEIWTTNQTRLAMSLADEPEMRAFALRLFGATDPTNDNRRLPAPAPAEMEEFGTYLNPRLRETGYEMAQLVNTNLMIVARTWRSGRIARGTQVSESHLARFTELFASGEPILITPFKPELPGRRRPLPGSPRENLPGPGPGFGNRNPMRLRGTNEFARTLMADAARARRGDITLMQVAAPIRDQENIVRGALALVINPDREFTKLLTIARRGESGETYAFDQTGLLISRSRFDDQLRSIGLLDATNSSSALNLRLHDPGTDLTRAAHPAQTNLASQPLIQIIADALEGDDGVTVKPTRDYRGVPVVAAWRWLPQLGFGVATQIDADEAYRPLRVLRWIFTALSSLLVLCAVGMILYSYSNRLWRRQLTEAQLKLKQLGQYTLEEKIGEGGMGVVYRARHALMRRETAVKLLLPDRADPTAVERFEREVCLTCQLTHPNTIQVYDYGRTPEAIFYYAMEYLHGLNLHQLVARFGPQPEGRVAHIMIQICDSLAEAHALGLVHRDIKPANVFLCERGGVPESVKVLDFGLVRKFNGSTPEDLSLTKKEGIVGTPWFMAPEAIQDSSKSDPRSDIYSVGALGYYLLTGKYIYDVPSLPEIYEKQMTTPVTPPGQLTENPTSPQFEQTLLRCLDKSAANRPASAVELRQLLLSSPLLAQWGSEERAVWWTQNRAQVYAIAEKDFASDSSVPTFKIDFASRIGRQTEDGSRKSEVGS